MSAIVMQTAHLLNDFTENEQTLIHDFVKAMHDNVKKARNAEYLAMVQGAIDRIAAGGGTIRDIIEGADD